MASLDRFDKLNPNQFALPGMEHHAHPFAKMLAHGYMAHPMIASDGGEHYLAALDMKTAKESGNDPLEHEAGLIEWHGSDVNPHRPGEIAWINNDSRTHRGASTPGLGEALYKTAKHVDMGQDTRPVHSDNLTEDGQAFHARVGGPTYRRGHEESRPEYGYHPFEQAEQRAHHAAYQRVAGGRKNLNQLQFSGM